MPKEHVDDFTSVKTFKFFNTNNLWIKLDGERAGHRKGLWTLRSRPDTRKPNF